MTSLKLTSTKFLSLSSVIKLKDKLQNESAFKFLFIITTFCIPLKLSFTYVGLVPLIILWSVKNRSKFSFLLLDDLLIPFIYFIFYTSIASLFGFDPLRSEIALFRFCFFGIFILITKEFVEKNGVDPALKIFVSGTAISSLYAILSQSINFLPKLFLGAVTQSGQLAMSSILVFGLCFYLLKKKMPSKSLYFYCFSMFCTFGALIVNLKRGPWIGVFFGLTFFSLFFSTRLTLLIIVSVIGIIFGIDKVYDRISGSIEDFLISGGRSDIWDIGAELIARFPFGIGYSNSPYLRLFSDSIPPQLQHFHSNFLNILVESGFFGLTLFCWWLCRICKVSFLTKTKDIAYSTNSSFETSYLLPLIGACLISWQIAGLVEYNFGDSEVILVAYFLIGILCSLVSSKHPKTSSG